MKGANDLPSPHPLDLSDQAGLSAMYFAVDNAFLAEVKQHFSTAEEVGSFLGYISAAAALLSILIGSISGKLLVSRFGTIDLVRLTDLCWEHGFGSCGCVGLAAGDYPWSWGVLP